MIFWKLGGPTFSEKSRLKTGSDSDDRPPLSARGAVCIGSRLKKQNRKKQNRKNKTEKSKTEKNKPKDLPFFLVGINKSKCDVIASSDRTKRRGLPA
jgi:hypothetical protein